MADHDSQPGSPLANRSAAREVARHSVRVRHLRLAIPALATGLMITYALSATPPQVDQAFTAQFSGFDPDEEGVRLARPRYSGEDLSGQAFEIAASTATRGADDPDIIGLDRPEAKRTTRSGDAVTVRAEEGLYDQNARSIDLNRNVELEQSGETGSFILRTEAAKVDIDGQVVRSTAEVRGEGDTGTVRADKATVFQGEDRLVLEGDVKLRIQPKKRGQASKDDDAAAEGDS